MEDLLLEMLRHYGLKEVFGPNANPEIIDMFHSIGYNWVDSDEVAWCSAALNYFCMKLGYEKTGLLNARSWLDKGVMIQTPQIGDVVILWRNSIDSWEGHVGLYISEDQNNVYICGGNQGNMLDIAPFLKLHVLGYRRLTKT